jgi:hypothetical protein
VRRPRPADAARLTVGALLLARPEMAVRVTRTPDGTGTRRVVRLLGARYLLQSTVGLAVTRQWLRLADTGVDVVHAGSMLGLAKAFPTHRRMALASAATAVLFAGLDLTERSRPWS